MRSKIKKVEPGARAGGVLLVQHVPRMDRFHRNQVKSFNAPINSLNSLNISLNIALPCMMFFTKV